MSKFVIFASARTGSSSLALVLQESRGVKLCFEPFNEKYHEWDQGDKINYLERIKGKASMNKVVDELFRKYNALKVLDYQLSSKLYFELLRRDDIKILFLRRKNLLKMAVSAMVALQTGEWQKADDDAIYQDLRPLDPDEIQKRIDYAKELNDKYDKFLKAERSGDYVELWYEDLFSEDQDVNLQMIKGICDFVDISLPPKKAIKKHMTPSIKKSNYKNVYNNIPNQSEIEEEFGKVF